MTFVDNLLIENARYPRTIDLQPHLGLMSLAAVVRLAGHAAVIYDPRRDIVWGNLTLDPTLYATMADRILTTAPDAVGFTALGCNFHCVVQVAAEIKRRSSLPILIGGPHATILHDKILARFPVFDLVVRHEAEATIVPTLENLGSRDFHGIAGVSWRRADGTIACTPRGPIIEDLDTLPIPAYDTYPIAELGLDTIRVDAGRGCPFSCTFCSTASFFGRNYRLKSTSRLVGELDLLHRTYGFDAFKLNHDLFVVSRKQVVAFCEAVASRGYRWSCSARVDCVDPELLRIMKEAGCHDVYFGIETGSRRMQEVSRKRLDLDLVEPTIDVAAKLRMTTTTSFITGYPEELQSEQDETLDLAARLHCRPGGLNIAQAHLLTPEPGTGLMDLYGSRLDYDGYVSDFNFPAFSTEDETLLRTDPQLFANHHFYPTTIERRRNIFATSLWMVLHTLGQSVLAYVLRGFDGRLSVLTEACFAFATQRSTSHVATMEGLIAFLGERFGNRHHIVSLVRYAQASVGVGLDAAPQAAARLHETDWRGAPLTLGAGIFMLRSIHDCHTLLDQIRVQASGFIDDSRTGDPGDRIFRHQSTRGVAVDCDRGVPAVTATTYTIDRTTADLIDRFKDPKSYWQCCREIDAAAGDGEPLFPDWRDIEKLCHMGVLALA